MAYSEPSALPIEVIDLIVDELGQGFVDHDNTNYQCPTLRIALYNLSLSTCHLRDHCRRYLWYTLILDFNNFGSQSPCEGYYQRVESLYRTLHADDGPMRCVRRVELIFGHYENEPYIPKILGTLTYLGSLHFDASDSEFSNSLVRQGHFSLIGCAVLDCIQTNPLRELSISCTSVPASFMFILPASLKQLVLNNVDMDDWEPELPGSYSASSIAVSLERMKLNVMERFCETRLSPLAAAFFKDLQYLDIEVSGGYTFNYFHQRLLASSHNLEALRVGYRDLGSSDWNHRILLLPSDPQQTSVSQKITKLTLESRNTRLMVDQRSYEMLVNAYLSNNLFRNLIYLELKAFWCNRDTLSTQAATSDPDLGSADRKLSDEEQFPHLKTIRLAFKESYWYVPQDMRDAIQKGIPRRQTEKLQQVRDAFSKTQRRGINLDFSWEIELGNL